MPNYLAIYFDSSVILTCSLQMGDPENFSLEMFGGRPSVASMCFLANFGRKSLEMIVVFTITFLLRNIHHHFGRKKAGEGKPAPVRGGPCLYHAEPKTFTLPNATKPNPPKFEPPLRW